MLGSRVRAPAGSPDKISDNHTIIGDFLFCGISHFALELFQIAIHLAFWGVRFFYIYILFFTFFVWGVNKSRNFYYLCHCTRSFERLRVAKSEKGIGWKSRTMPVAVSSISRVRNWGWSLSLPLVKTGKARSAEQVRRPACAYVDFMPAGLRVRIKTMF